MYLTEEFTKDRCNRLFREMIDEFSKFSNISLNKYQIDNELDWMRSSNRKALGRCTALSNYKRYYAVDPDTGEMIFMDEVDDFDPEYVNSLDFSDYIQERRFKISLNPAMLNFEEDGERIIKDTIAHELCHTLPGCFNHGSEFHRNAQLIRQGLGYYIDTKADVDASAYFRKYLPDAPYKVICDKCGNETSFARIQGVVENPIQYSCAKCDGSVSSYKLNKSTGEYELFRSSTSPATHKYNFMCTNCGTIVGLDRRNNAYKDYIEMMHYGRTSICPKCDIGTMYLDDNGIIITPAELSDPKSGASKVYRRLFM